MATFDKSEFKNVFAENDERDFIIYKLPLDPASWIVDPGIAPRQQNVGSPTKRPKRDKTTQKKTEFPKADVIKTPRFSFQGVRVSQEVRVLALPAPALGRWEAKTTVSSVGPLWFTLQAVSAPGASGGAVVATDSGEIIGYVGGNYDATDNDGKEPSFECYAYSVHGLPPGRPSRNPPTPEK